MVGWGVELLADERMTVALQAQLVVLLFLVTQLLLALPGLKLLEVDRSVGVG